MNRNGLSIAPVALDRSLQLLPGHRRSGMWVARKRGLRITVHPRVKLPTTRQCRPRRCTPGSLNLLIIRWYTTGSQSLHRNMMYTRESRPHHHHRTTISVSQLQAAVFRFPAFNVRNLLVPATSSACLHITFSRPLWLIR